MMRERESSCLERLPELPGTAQPGGCLGEWGELRNKLSSENPEKEMCEHQQPATSQGGKDGRDEPSRAEEQNLHELRYYQEMLLVHCPVFAPHSTLLF